MKRDDMADVSTDFESDELLRLLTDALRAGPGSPEWREAVARIRSANPQDADEYRMLLDAREDLEAGREYRSIRPGPNFTRKVLQAVEEEAEGKKAAVPSANLIALAAAGVILVIVIVVAIALIKGGPGSRDGTLDDLKEMPFKTVGGGGDFAGAIPPEWTSFGLTPTVVAGEKALRGAANRQSATDFAGGGIRAANAIAADKPFALEATIHLTHQTENVDLQLFVSDSTDFGNPKATSPRELVINVHGAKLSVFTPDGKLARDVDLPRREQSLQLLLKVNQRFAVVELDGQVLYAGDNRLGAAGGRYAGARFLTKGADDKDLSALTLRSLRLLRP